MEKNILILEDDVALAIQWSHALISAGYHIFVTHGAAEAAKVYFDNTIDLCIVDFLIYTDEKPAANGGITFMGMLTAPEKKNTKILGVSGYKPKFSNVNPEQYFLTFGANRYLPKPFSDDELLTEVTQILA